ncbi:MAG: hypothetical protein SGJ19_08055, partial [Planctomycetia bacterium]|nr:hypothetical protein [Planctomycetia bacterium]
MLAEPVETFPDLAFLVSGEFHHRLTISLEFRQLGGQSLNRIGCHVDRRFGSRGPFHQPDQRGVAGVQFRRQLGDASIQGVGRLGCRRGRGQTGFQPLGFFAESLGKFPHQLRKQHVLTNMPAIV